MGRPVVVIPACTTLIEGYVFDAVARKYTAAVAEIAECQPFFIPVGPGVSDIGAILDVADAILLTGSRSNVCPDRYDGPPHAEGTPEDHARDATTLPLIRAAIAAGLPLLAICRGFQLLNVLRGGDLIQHLPEQVGHEGHRETLGSFSEHPVEVRSGTMLAAILGERHEGVKSSHHQGVGRVGEGLVETAWAVDGSLEGLEDPSLRFAVGVLWHPEMEDDKRLFEALVAEARRYRRERRQN